jgi:hypothetical protein
LIHKPFGGLAKGLSAIGKDARHESLTIENVNAHSSKGTVITPTATGKII